MWFEVNVRLYEVTDLKWPHGTECQCGNSTLAMSWPNHVQILSFASMASRQGAVKHRFVSKTAGSCSSYDVMAPWPDLTWSICFYQKLRKVCPIRYPKTRYAPPFFRYLRKTSGGGGCTNPPVRARVKGLKKTLAVDSWHCKCTVCSLIAVQHISGRRYFKPPEWLHSILHFQPTEFTDDTQCKKMANSSEINVKPSRVTDLLILLSDQK